MRKCFDCKYYFNQDNRKECHNPSLFEEVTLSDITLPYIVLRRVVAEGFDRPEILNPDNTCGGFKVNYRLKWKGRYKKLPSITGKF